MERPQLIQEIINAIGPNADNRITGTILRNILIKVVDGTQLNLVGMAYTDTVPVTDIEDLTYAPIYVAAGTGTYTNFDAIELDNELAILKYTEDGWIKQTVIVLSEIAFPQVQALIDLAEKWAENPEDTEVETGKYSAKHHAAKAADSETNAVAAKNYIEENIDTINAAPPAAVAAAASATLSEKWAEEAEDTEVETGKYSSKHYATKSENAYNNALSFLVNFFDTTIIALNSRILAESATVDLKLRYYQELLDKLAAAGITPSLVWMTGVYKTGKNYSVLPADGSGDFTYSRNDTVATSQRPDGTWQVGWPANTPRRSAAGGRIVEPQRQILIPYPRSFANAYYWTKSGAMIEGDAATAGSELITDIVDREFTSDTGWWKKDGSLTISDGSANFIDDNDSLSKPNFMTLGKMYYITFEIKNFDSGVLYSAYDGYTAAKLITDEDIYHNYCYCYDASRTTIVWHGLHFVGSIDNISIKEVQGFNCPFVNSSGINTREAYRVVASASDATIRLASALTVTPGTTYTSSIFMRRVSGTGQVYLIDVNNTDRAITLTSEWQRFEYGAVAGSTSGQIGFKLKSFGDVVEVCHAQLEAGTTATSPIYGAEGSVLTRLAEQISKTGVSALIGQTEGSIAIEFDAGSGFDLYVNSLEALGLTGIVRFCFVYTATTMKLFVNGVLVDSETGTYDWSSMDSIELGNFNNISQYNGTINQLINTTSAISDAEAIAITL